MYHCTWNYNLIHFNVLALHFLSLLFHQVYYNDQFYLNLIRLSLKDMVQSSYVIPVSIYRGLVPS
jgi:hypothetical protein